MNEPRLTISAQLRARHRAGDAAYSDGATASARPTMRIAGTAATRRRTWPASESCSGAGRGRFPGRGGALRRAAALPGRAPAASPPPATRRPAPRPARARGPQSPDPAAGINVIASLGASAPEPPLPAVPGDAAARTAPGRRVSAQRRGLRMPVPARPPEARPRRPGARSDPGQVAGQRVDRPYGLAVTSTTSFVPPSTPWTPGCLRTVVASRSRACGEVTAACSRSGPTRLPGAPSRPVLLAGVPGDEYGVPLVALGALLAERRVACRSFGPALPAAALAAAAAGWPLPRWCSGHSSSRRDVAVVAALPVTARASGRSSPGRAGRRRAAARGTGSPRGRCGRPARRRASASSGDT